MVRLGALIVIHPIALKSVVTPATLRIIERQAMYILAIKPPHGREGVIFIFDLPRDMIGGETCLDHGAGIDGLLVERGPRLPARIPPMTADR